MICFPLSTTTASLLPPPPLTPLPPAQDAQGSISRRTGALWSGLKVVREHTQEKSGPCPFDRFGGCLSLNAAVSLIQACHQVSLSSTLAIVLPTLNTLSSSLLAVSQAKTGAPRVLSIAGLSPMADLFIFCVSPWGFPFFCSLGRNGERSIFFKRIRSCRRCPTSPPHLKRYWEGAPKEYYCAEADETNTHWPGFPPSPTRPTRCCPCRNCFRPCPSSLGHRRQPPTSHHVRPPSDTHGRGTARSSNPSASYSMSIAADCCTWRDKTHPLSHAEGSASLRADQISHLPANTRPPAFGLIPSRFTFPRCGLKLPNLIDPPRGIPPRDRRNIPSSLWALDHQPPTRPHGPPESGKSVLTVIKTSTTHPFMVLYPCIPNQQFLRYSDARQKPSPHKQRYGFRGTK